MISFLLMVVGLAMAASWGVAWYFDDPLPARRGLAFSATLTLLVGVIVRIVTHGPIELSWRDGIGIGTLGWFFAVAFGALPFIWSGVITDPVAALFETVSGFTTTGASVIPVLETVPKGILFWRAMTHFLGGMGILVLCVAILPFLGIGGMQLYKAEIAGPSKDRLTPRITNTAKLLWGVYVLLCIAGVFLLRFGGMTWFDAICHATASVATGGFSTRTNSIGAYNSLYIEVVITVLMFIGAANFALHFGVLRGRILGYFRDPEFRFYLCVWAIAWLVIALNIWHTSYPSAGTALRNSVFATTSIMSTTGFCTANYDTWPAFSKMILVLCMLVGGCVGSTAGGIKHLRLFIVMKKATRQIKLFVHPQAVMQVKLGKQPVEDSIVLNVLTFVILYIIVLVIASAVMTLFTRDTLSAVTSVVACTGNVGPGLGSVGPVQNYADIHAGGKIILIICMLLGRLEFYTMLALLFPSFWKK